MTLNRREASLDSTPVCLNRREAKMGSGDWSPGGAWGGNPIVTPVPPSRSDSKDKNQGAKRHLIQLKPHRAANPVTPALGRAPQGG